MNKQFQEVPVGSVFTLNETQYKKVDTAKISCCKSINAIAVQNVQNRIFVQPTQEVVVTE